MTKQAKQPQKTENSIDTGIQIGLGILALIAFLIITFWMLIGILQP